VLELQLHIFKLLGERQMDQTAMSYDEFVLMMDESFNYNLDFQSWDREEFLSFCRNFLDGKTEYCVDEYFQKHYAKKCEEYLGGRNAKT
tara:strand:+ start:304 stop:570 length:267 start_codon:yes stop_codon:yes gene_type:complete